MRSDDHTSQMSQFDLRFREPENPSVIPKIFDHGAPKYLYRSSVTRSIRMACRMINCPSSQSGLVDLPTDRSQPNYEILSRSDHLNLCGLSL